CFVTSRRSLGMDPTMLLQVSMREESVDTRRAVAQDIKRTPIRSVAIVQPDRPFFSCSECGQPRRSGWDLHGDGQRLSDARNSFHTRPQVWKAPHLVLYKGLLARTENGKSRRPFLNRPADSASRPPATCTSSR